MRDDFRNLKDISKKDINIAGGKGASLGEMVKIKMPVPAGFVILASVFDRFLEENNLRTEIEAILRNINYKNIISIKKASEKIRGLFRDAKFPKSAVSEMFKEFSRLKTKYVAVRSSATAEDSLAASWAGELESYLNVIKKNLPESIKKCWSSLFTPRSIFYRHEKHLHKQKISVAIIVQKMIQSEISGVVFTVHPVIKEKNQMIIEAGRGLGEKIVGGKITPDKYFINKKDWSIADIGIGRQKNMIIQKLTGRQIIKLAQLCHQIEKHYKYPQDIEWAMKNNNFYILQSRPITTL